MRLYIVLAIIFTGLTLSTQVQGQARNSVLLTGVVMDAEQQLPLPYVNIRLGDSNYGTATDVNGHFTLFVNPGDTLTFTSIGYRAEVFIMPSEITKRQYSLIQLMWQETTVLSEIVVFPWPTIDQFKDAFLDTDPGVAEDQLVREVQLRVQDEAKMKQMEIYEAQQMQHQKLYELNGIFPPSNFLNPMRWSDFVRDVKKSKPDN